MSRRSKGVSVGVNLNPDKLCNFDCVYCQVDRTTPGPAGEVELPRLRDELADMLDLVAGGQLFEMERFRDTPESLRRLNDIAFSGDGEPTTCPEFLEVVSDRLRALARVGEYVVPYERGDVLAALHRAGEVLVEVHDDHGTRVRARLPESATGRFAEFATTPE